MLKEGAHDVAQARRAHHHRRIVGAAQIVELVEAYLAVAVLVLPPLLFPFLQRIYNLWLDYY